MDDLMQYHIDYVKELQRRGQSPDQARLQFGWMDKDSKFIIGNREVGPRKTGYSPASSATLNIVNYYEPKGTLAGWKRSFNLLVGDENSPQAFAIMSTFGSPLVKFSGIKGALISLVNNRSGTGKTTILKLINSVWGHPEETMLQKEDTYMSKQNRLGVLNNMPATIDEITNMRPEDVSDMAYAITLGRGRNRMEAAVNRERLNTTRWALIAVATGNSFLSDKLGALKATADGELMRLIEIEIDLAENPEATELLDSLSENYGLAGETYIRYIVNNRNEVSRSIDKMRERIIRDTGAQRKERYWVNVVAVNIVGGIIAQKLGLHDYNMRAIYKWAISYFSNMRSVAETHVVETEHILGEFLNENISSYLVVDKSKINPVTGSHVVKPVQHRVIVRYEIDTKLMFIAKKEFKEYCVSRQINVDNAVKECSHDYTYRGLSKKRLTAGTGVTSPPVEVYTFYAPIQPSDLDAQDRLNEL
jgi:energy-coupling factor transporter ATP-binding protein EcfA2